MLSTFYQVCANSLSKATSRFAYVLVSHQHNGCQHCITVIPQNFVVCTTALMSMVLHHPQLTKSTVSCHREHANMWHLFCRPPLPRLENASASSTTIKSCWKPGHFHTSHRENFLHSLLMCSLKQRWKPITPKINRHRARCLQKYWGPRRASQFQGTSPTGRAPKKNKCETVATAFYWN